jgi:metallo-beta-lactamase class B
MRAIATIIIFLLFKGSLFGQSLEGNLKISHLTGDFYVFTTYSYYKGNRIPANGMYLITSKGAVVIDTPWDTTQFQPLLDSIMVRHNKNVILCIATHFHEDRTAGLEYFRKIGADTYTTRQTDELSRNRGMKRAQYFIDKDTIFKIGQYSFQTYYPGKGHSPDNIVIWFEKERVLYGGCLIKSAEDNDLGNLSDASVKDYEITIRNVQDKCKKPKYIITGHNDWVNIKSLEHTLEIAEQLYRKDDH